MSTARVSAPPRAAAHDRTWPIVPLAGALVAVLAGPLTVLMPRVAVVLVAGIIVVGLVATFPPLAAYGLLALTPLVAGMERGAILPVLRPSEAVAGVVIAGLVLRGLYEVAQGAPLRIRSTAVDRAIVAFALAGSVIPLLWMQARGKPMTGDDVLYAVQPWKYVTVYFIVRASVRREAEVRRCLAISLGAACIVGTLAILQSLSVLGVPELLTRLYAPGGEVADFDIARGSSTLASSLAVADVMIYSVAIGAAWAVHSERARRPLIAVVVLCLIGTVASGQYSGFLSIPIAIVALGLITGRLWQFLVWSFYAVPLAAAAMWPVISTRLSGFESNAGLPRSWVGRWDNLNIFFWPELGNFNWVLGVRPSARVAAPESWREWVWIESGHTWLLWSGGVPFLLAFFALVWFAVRATARVARSRTDRIGAAAAAAFTALWVMFVLMILDPHITLRGSADLLFALLALALVGWHGAAAGPAAAPAPAGGRA